MRVCSQCEYQNPGNHRFCQQCGASLSDVVESSELAESSEGSSTSSTEPTASEAESAEVTWYAIYSAQGQPAATEDTSAPARLNSSGYLDSNQRYQILEDSLRDPSGAELEFRVRDRHPTTPSYLEQLYGISSSSTSSALTAGAQTDQTTSAPVSEAPRNSPPAHSESELDEPTDPSYDSTAQYVTTPPPDVVQPSRDLTLPAIAQLYLSLQEQLYPSLPLLHDAWQQDGQVILLLEDRSQLPPILTALQDEAIPPFQVVSWLYYTTKLWDVLQGYGCCHSLLDLTNLRIDEDCIICLQRLHLNSPADDPLTLRHLGRLWQRLFQQAQRTYIGSIAQLCYEVEAATITTVQQLQDRLRLIADEFQFDVPEDANLPPLDPSLSFPGYSQVLNMNEPNPDSPQRLDVEPAPQVPPMDEDEAQLDDWQETTRPVSLESMDTEAEGDDLPTVVLPMQLLSVEDAGRTDIGRQRKDNQDYFAIKTDIRKTETPTGRSLQAQGLYILCDGMGGHAGGEVASTLATQNLETYFETHWNGNLPNEAMLVEGIRLANNAIYDMNIQSMRSGSGRMGTTLVLMLLKGTEVAIAHVGDSRVYRYSRRQGLELLTVDHEVGQRDIQRGMDPVEAYSHPEAYQLTQALGPRDQDFVHPDVTFLEVTEDTVFLLCSDGLTDNDLVETYCQSHVEPLLSPQTSLEQGAGQLIELANHYNGHDNISVILIRLRVRPATVPVSRRASGL